MPLGDSNSWKLKRTPPATTHVRQSSTSEDSWPGVGDRG